VKRVSAGAAPQNWGSCLTCRERAVIELRYGLSGYAPYTQDQCRRILRIHPRAYEALEAKAVKKLERALGPGWLDVARASAAGGT
jgi:DNA-directed RNA polymerase sigma subunit (sigma70/sigma32)